MSQYSELAGSFIRTGQFPLEADYIFKSEEELLDFYSDDLNSSTLHEGLFKIVAGDPQALYWVISKNGLLLLHKLIEAESILLLNSKVTALKEILDSNNVSLTSLNLLVESLSEQVSLNSAIAGNLEALEVLLKTKYKGLQSELDQTLLGIGLNGDGTYDTRSVSKTNYLKDSTSVMDSLKILDERIYNQETPPILEDAAYSPDTEQIILTFVTKDGESKEITIDALDLINEWMVQNSLTIQLLRFPQRNGGPDTLIAHAIISTKANNALKVQSDGLYVTEHQSLDNYYTKPEIDSKLSSLLTNLEIEIIDIPNISDTL